MNFDFQWTHLPDKALEHNVDRIKELLELTKLKKSYFKGITALDVGCGTGRYTYALQQLGAKVTSVDISPVAIKKTRKINPDSHVLDLNKLSSLEKKYDFVFCWGVLNHIEDPNNGFAQIAKKVNLNGKLHIMVYNEKNQSQYEIGRELFKSYNTLEKIEYILREHGNQNTHGWWDAYNPVYNHSFNIPEVKQWFKKHAFSNVKVTTKNNINIRGIQRGVQ